MNCRGAARLALAAIACTWLLTAAAQAPGDGEAASALERYQAGDYAQAARIGLGVLARAPGLHELRLAVANSLAWTGRYDPAIEQYQALLGTAYDSQARIGIANVMRWRGQADLAEPHYLAVLEREPGNEEAQSGLALGGRELRPALIARLGRTADSEDLSRQELSLAYRRWSADRSWRFELGALADRYHAPGRSWSAQGAHASVWATRLPLAPRVDASVYDSELRGAQGFATLQLEPVRDRLRLRFGRVNWARLAFNAGAAADGLTASTLGVFGESDVGAGVLRGRLDGYEISDSNRVFDGELQLTPAWQPLPYRLTWFGGVYGRRADHTDPRYWSPRPGYGLGFVGLQRGWFFERSDVTASLRRGFGFTDSARNSWGAGLNARHWIRGDIAIGLEAWAVEVPRPEKYRMHQIAAFVQHLW